MEFYLDKKKIKIMKFMGKVGRTGKHIERGDTALETEKILSSLSNMHLVSQLSFRFSCGGVCVCVERVTRNVPKRRWKEASRERSPK